MLIERAHVSELCLPLSEPYETSSARYTFRGKAVVRLETSEGVGYGENQANTLANYSSEVTATSTLMLERFILPAVVGREFESIDDLALLLRGIRGAPMAKASVEAAVWDVLAQQQGVSLSTLLGGVRNRIPVGICFGIEPSIEHLLDLIGRAPVSRYQRIKLKVRPGWDVDVVRAVRRSFPDTPIMVDANGAYSLDDLDTLSALDRFQLLMIEQPLTAGDLVDHAALQRQLETPVCLDESIRTIEDARAAISLGSARIFNIKPARVGGLAAARTIGRLCEDNGIGVWCGSLLEWGIGRVANLAAAALPSFVYPNDIEPSDRFYAVDVIDPPTVVEGGFIAVPDGIGLGVAVDDDTLERFTIRRAVIHADKGARRQAAEAASTQSDSP